MPLRQVKNTEWAVVSKFDAEPSLDPAYNNSTLKATLKPKWVWTLLGAWVTWETTQDLTEWPGPVGLIKSVRIAGLWAKHMGWGSVNITVQAFLDERLVKEFRVDHGEGFWIDKTYPLDIDVPTGARWLKVKLKQWGTGMIGLPWPVIDILTGNWTFEFTIRPHPPPPDKGKVYGIVADREGRPVAGATVSANERFRATTDGRGYYELVLDPGFYTLRASHPAYEEAAVTISVGPGQLIEQNFFLTPRVATIAGVVKDAKTGAAIPDVAIRADGFGTTTDANGSYSLTVAPGRAYTVTASKSGYRDARITTPVLGPGQAFRADFVLEPEVFPGVPGWVWAFFGLGFLALIGIAAAPKLARRKP